MKIIHRGSAKPLEQDKAPLMGSQVELATKMHVATKYHVVSYPAKPNTQAEPTIRIYTKKRTILHIGSKRTELAQVTSSKLTLPKQRANGFDITWGKPERFGGCFEQPVSQGEPVRPHRGDYKLLRDCIL